MCRAHCLFCTAQEDALRALAHNQGGQDRMSESQSTIISVLGIVAVLIVNVTYVGYITPPGGSHPSWETCPYWPYIAFFCLNGLAFLFSLCAVVVMVFMPLLLDRPGNDWRKPVIKWGIAHLAVGLLFTLLAFCAAGLANSNFQEPEYTCSFVPCSNGGIYCSKATFANVTRALNKFEGRCFQVTNITSGAHLREASTPLEKIAYSSTPISHTVSIADFDDSFSDNICYLGGIEVNSGEDDISFKPKNTICMADKPFATLSDDLTRLAPFVDFNHQALWRVMYNVTTEYPTPVTRELLVVPSILDDATCKAMHDGPFSFVSIQEIIYIVNVEADKPAGFQWDNNTQSATLAGPGFLVHDELPYRCNDLTQDALAGSATWCRYDTHNTSIGNYLYLYNTTNRCFPGEDCPGYAVRLDGSYVLRSNLADLAADSNHIFLGDNATKKAVGIAVFCILAVGIAVNAATVLWLWVQSCQ